jgi:hypothetical protein
MAGRRFIGWPSGFSGRDRCCGPNWGDGCDRWCGPNGADRCDWGNGANRRNRCDWGDRGDRCCRPNGPNWAGWADRRNRCHGRDGGYRRYRRDGHRCVIAWYTTLQGDTKFQLTANYDTAWYGTQMGAACTFDSFNVKGRSAVGTGWTGPTTLTATLVVNGVDTALSCNYTATTVSTNYSCLATSPTVAVSAGDIVSIKYTHTVSASTALLLNSVVTKCN